MLTLFNKKKEEYKKWKRNKKQKDNNSLFSLIN